MKIRKFLAFAMIGILSTSPYLFGQKISQNDYLKIFLDCGSCDSDYLRQNVTFVDYVHDRKDADVHILVTTQASGGGQEYQIKFTGIGSYTGRDNNLIFTSSSTDTDDEVRKRFIRYFVSGLLPYLDNKITDQIKVTFTGQNNNSSMNIDDPWNYWVFSISTYMSLNGEEKSSNSYMSGAIRASRVTENWKINFNLVGNRRRATYTLSDGYYVKSSSDGYHYGGYVVKSLGEHWGIGSGAESQTNTFYNLNPSYKVALSGEYNLFPYKESSDRIFTVAYKAGLIDLNYKERTIFGKIHERVFVQGLDVDFTATRQWGNANVGTQFLQLGDPKTVRLEVDGDINWRIVRGFSINIYGGTSFIRDQIYLPAKDSTPEEILLRQKAQATKFGYFFGIGFGFEFGSIHNNFVNSRSSNTSFGTF